ncbi:MAG TPA: hypothetical protein VFZ97_11400 [Acidimicrobiales bacterium]
MRRALGVAAVLLGVAAMSVGSAGLAAAQGSGGKGNKGGAPPGNNGTIKIDQNVLTDVGKVDHANHPHVSCQFALSFFGFDTGLRQTTVAYSAQPPSGKFGPVAPTLGRGSFAFQGHGPGPALDWSEPYKLDVTGLKANPNQGYHIKVDVEVTGSIGSDDKYKVFWYKPCIVPTSTTSSTSTTSTTVKHRGTTTTTTTTVPPVTNSVPQTGSTTTTSPTTAPRNPTTSTSTPPTTTHGGVGQIASTTTTTLKPAAGAAPGSRSGLAFTSGPTPSGAGTDLGLFRPINASPLPWVLLIVGGVLLGGAGTFSLTGTRIKKWVRGA